MHSHAVNTIIADASVQLIYFLEVFQAVICHRTRCPGQVCFFFIIIILKSSLFERHAKDDLTYYQRTEFIIVLIYLGVPHFHDSDACLFTLLVLFDLM